MYQVQTSLAAEAKIATLTHRIEALELQGHVQVNQASAPICNGYGKPGHVLEECPTLMNQIENSYAQVNVAYYRHMNDCYAPTYNPK